jgi:hypothetical protein
MRRLTSTRPRKGDFKHALSLNRGFPQTQGVGSNQNLDRTSGKLFTLSANADDGVEISIPFVCEQSP